MKTYPSIEGSSKAPRQICYGFVKYDGSNLRFEWSKKRGWYKFGTRKMMFNQSHPEFGQAIPLFTSKYADDLEKIFKSSKLFRGVNSVVVFAEYFGAKSFAGQHVDDDKKNIILFDVNPINKGFISPKEFIDEFSHLDVAECVYHGNMNEELIKDVKESKFDFVSKYEIKTEVPEGIICKGGSRHGLWMRKIKCQNYFDELKKRKPSGWEKMIEENQI